MRAWRGIAVAGGLLIALTGCGGGAGGDEAGSDASASFASPSDGDTVTNPVTVEMEAEGFEVVPAAESGEGQGHFHIMVDTDCVAEGETIPTDDPHRHFGDGSTSAELEMEPGEHTLCLQAGDANHTAFGETDQISITVE